MIKNGMLVALIDEYRRATIDYKSLLEQVSQEYFIKFLDLETTELDCKSIQTITFHLIHSGYVYAHYIQSKSNDVYFEYREDVKSPEFAILEIDKMLDFTEQSLKEYWYESTKKLKKYSYKSHWNVTFDLEQLLEHAIVHVLRHRRQIENLLKKE